MALLPKTKKSKLCNMTYSDPATGVKRLCQDGTARPAIRHRVGAYVCADCWPYVQDKLLEKYVGVDGYTHGLGLMAINKAFKVVR